MNIGDADWKAYKDVRILAEERFSQHVIDAAQRICANDAMTVQQRHQTLSRLVKESDKEWRRIFEPFQRSSAYISLLTMRRHDLVSEEEMLAFSPPIQQAAQPSKPDLN